MPAVNRRRRLCLCGLASANRLRDARPRPPPRALRSRRCVPGPARSRRAVIAQDRLVPASRDRVRRVVATRRPTSRRHRDPPRGRCLIPGRAHRARRPTVARSDRSPSTPCAPRCDASSDTSMRRAASPRTRRGSFDARRAPSPAPGVYRRRTRSAARDTTRRLWLRGGTRLRAH